MFKCIGLFILFMILLVDDFYWIELGMLLYEVNFKGVQQRKLFLEYMRKDLFMIVIYFECSFDVLMKYVILFGLELLGKVLDYFVCVEF